MEDGEVLAKQALKDAGLTNCRLLCSAVDTLDSTVALMAMVCASGAASVHVHSNGLDLLGDRPLVARKEPSGRQAKVDDVVDKGKGQINVQCQQLVISSTHTGCH